MVYVENGLAKQQQQQVTSSSTILRTIRLDPWAWKSTGRMG